MVHCDFGWGGDCNGFYIDGVFNLKSKYNIYDNENDNGKKINYNNSVRILVYD